MGNNTQLQRAFALENAGEFVEALAAFQECFDDPSFDEGDLRFHCGWCAENQKKPAEALAWYELAADLTRIPECKLNSYFRAGWVLMHEKEPMKAADHFRYAVDYGNLVGLRNESYQHSMFWYAHCLELKGRYLEALKWYRIVQALAQLLDPESRLRQIVCLVHVGSYEEALRVCRTFNSPPPSDFSKSRYEELRIEVRKESVMLEEILSSEPRFGKVASHAAI